MNLVKDVQVMNEELYMRIKIDINNHETLLDAST